MKPLIETDNEFICDIQAPCFQFLNGEEMELIRMSKTQILFRKGENLTKQGAFSSYVLFIINGFARQYVEGDSNRNFNLSILKSGDFVGLSAVFNNNTFQYSATALSNTQVYLIEKDAIAKVLNNNAKFAFQIIKRYCTQNSGLYNSIKQVMFHQMNGRLASALLFLSSDEYGGLDIFSSLTRRDIADFAGISMESAVKLLKAFEKDGLIKLDEKDIIVLNREGLTDISKRG